MAYIQEKTKGKEIVSFKIKACLGRGANGKQIFKCTTWYAIRNREVRKSLWPLSWYKFVQDGT